MKSLSNVIKAVQFQEQIRIDSNPKAELFFAGLHQQLAGVRMAETEDALEREAELTSQAEQAMAEKASELLAAAKEEGRKVIEQARVEANIQKEAVLKEAQEKGYRDGYNSGIAALQEKEAQLAQIKAQYQREYEQQIKELEPLFSELVIQYVEKLTGILREEHQPVIGYLMAEAIRGTGSSRYYILHVSEEDYEEACKEEEKLRAMVSNRSDFEILSEKGLVSGECKLETDSCVIDASLGTRLSLLEENIRLLAAE